MIAKILPQGVWITVRNLGAHTTDVDVQRVFAEGGIHLDLEQISVDVQDNRQYAGVIISFSRAQVCDLVDRAMDGKGLAFVIPTQRKK